MVNIIKEILIVILLCLAVVVIMGVVFYGYIPTNVVVPSNVQPYTTSKSIKEEIEEEIVEYPKESLVFEITDSDLTLYKKTESYVEGKANPFEAYVEPEIEEEEGEFIGGSGGTSTYDTSSKPTTNTTDTVQTFYEDTKLK